MATAKLFWSGRSQAVRLPKDFRFSGKSAEVRIRRHGNAVILKPLADDWSWLDAIAAPTQNSRFISRFTGIWGCASGRPQSAAACSRWRS
jgi:virulence-associated protein VagC